MALIITNEMLASAAAGLALQDCQPDELFDLANLPIYLTDDEGIVIYANEACETFTGRAPSPDVDRWCVTWKLYTNAGEFLPHDQCPMALAIRSKTAIRGASAIAERPDGTRAAFRPFPTPIFDRSGRMSGAVNVLMPA